MNALIVVSLICPLSTVLTFEAQGDGKSDVNVRNEVIFESSEHLEILQVELKRQLNEAEEALLIWKVEKGKLINPNTTDYRKFASDTTYIALETRRNTEDQTKKSKICDLYYWIGKHSTKGNSEYEWLRSALSSTAKIHKEIEGEESPNFKATLERIARTLYKVYPERERMFLISVKVNMEPILAVVYPSIVHTQNKDLCIILNIEIVYIYCGESVLGIQKILAENMVKKFLHVKGPNAKEVKIYRNSKSLLNLPWREQVELLQFFLEFENIPKESAKRNNTITEHNGVSNHFHFQAAEPSAKPTQRKTEGQRSRYVARKKSKVKPYVHVVEKKRRMILITDGHTDIFVREEKLLSLEHFQGSAASCIVLSTKTMYVYCGHAASAEQEFGANEIANNLLQDLGPNSKKVTILRKNEPLSEQPSDEIQKLVEFFSEFETTSEQAEQIVPKRKKKNWMIEKIGNLVANDHAIGNQRLNSSTSSKNGLNDPLLQNEDGRVPAKA